jgi:protein-S-isoprenylcysteine O-methyltransferase Ste14
LAKKVAAALVAHCPVLPSLRLSTLLLAGWFCVSRFTPLGILTVLAFVHFMFVARWEEKELTERFGKTYLDYKTRVPFLIPRLRRKSGEG